MGPLKRTLLFIFVIFCSASILCKASEDIWKGNSSLPHQDALLQYEKLGISKESLESALSASWIVHDPIDANKKTGNLVHLGDHIFVTNSHVVAEFLDNNKTRMNISLPYKQQHLKRAPFKILANSGILDVAFIKINVRANSPNIQISENPLTPKDRILLVGNMATSMSLKHLPFNEHWELLVNPGEVQLNEKVSSLRNVSNLVHWNGASGSGMYHIKNGNLSLVGIHVGTIEGGKGYPTKLYPGVMTSFSSIAEFIDISALKKVSLKPDYKSRIQRYFDSFLATKKRPDVSHDLFAQTKIKAVGGFLSSALQDNNFSLDEKVEFFRKAFQARDSMNANQAIFIFMSIHKKRPKFYKTYVKGFIDRIVRERIISHGDLPIFKMLVPECGKVF